MYMPSTNIFNKFVLLQVILSSELVRKQDAKKQGPRPLKKSSLFTKVTECFPGYFDLISTLAGALKCPHRSWKPGCQVWKVVAQVIAKRWRAVWVAYGVHAQDFGYSSVQLWRSLDFRESGSKYAVRRDSLPPLKEPILFLLRRFIIGPKMRRSWVVSVSAYQIRNAGSILSFAAFLSLSFSAASSGADWPVLVVRVSARGPPS